MILRFYCVPLEEGGLPGPLLATATIPEAGNSDHGLAEGNIELFYPDLDLYALRKPRWTAWVDEFRNSLKKKMNSYVTLTNRSPLSPWSRLAFEHIARFGLPSLGHVVEAKLFEEDGSEWDPATATPLYGPDPGPYGKDHDLASESSDGLRRASGRFSLRYRLQRDGTTQDLPGQ